MPTGLVQHLTACFGRAGRGLAIAEELHRLDTVPVVADHPVARRLPIHAGGAPPSARLMPSSALAIAGKHRAARMSHSLRHLVRHRGVRSFRIARDRLRPGRFTSAAPIAG